MKSGTIEWMQDKKRFSRTINRLLIRWTDGTISGPVPFGGQLMVGESSNDLLWIFQEERQPRGEKEGLRDWLQSHAGAVTLGVIFGAAAYKNLVFFFG